MPEATNGAGCNCIIWLAIDKTKPNDYIQEDVELHILNVDLFVEVNKLVQIKEI